MPGSIAVRTSPKARQVPLSSAQLSEISQLSDLSELSELHLKPIALTRALACLGILPARFVEKIERIPEPRHTQQS